MSKKKINKSVAAGSIRINNLIFASCDDKLFNLDFDENCLPKLNRKNAEKCEALIKGNEKINSPYDEKKRPKKKMVDFSEKEWIEKVMYIANKNHTRTPNDTKKYIAQLFFDKKNCEKLSVGDPTVVNDVLCRLDRKEISLVSKVCKWVYYWENEPTKKGFSVYDSVVLGVLPYYAKRSGVSLDGKDLSTYGDYHQTISDICHKTGLSLHLFDCLLWYFYRGNPIQAALAATLGKY